MVNDQLSDLLTRIRNAQRAGHKNAIVINSTLNRSVLEVLKKEGLVDSYEKIERDDGSEARQVRVGLKYFSSGKALISKIDRVSKPGCRKYSSVEDLPKVMSGLGIAIVSTSRGVVSDREARQLRVGGEVLAVVG